MIVTGLLGDLAPEGSGLKWLWFLISTGAFVFIYLCLWGAMRQEARKTGKLAERVYVRNTAFLSVVWLAYPVVWALGPEGLRQFSTNTDLALWTLLDLTAKVVFGFYSFANSRARTTEELAKGLLPEHELRPAPAAFEESRHRVRHDAEGEKAG